LLFVFREIVESSGTFLRICSRRYFSGSARIFSRFSFIRSRERRTAYMLEAKRRWSMAMMKPTARPGRIVGGRLID